MEFYSPQAEIDFFDWHLPDKVYSSSTTRTSNPSQAAGMPVRKDGPSSEKPVERTKGVDETAANDLKNSLGTFYSKLRPPSTIDWTLPGGPWVCRVVGAPCFGRDLGSHVRLATHLVFDEFHQRERANFDSVSAQTNDTRPTPPTRTQAPASARNGGSVADTAAGLSLLDLD